MKRLYTAVLLTAFALGTFASFDVSTTAAALAAPYTRQAQRVAGTIIYVNGHLVTLQQSRRRIVINDRPALNRRRTGRVAVGRQIVAYGYWRDGTFFAYALR